jgi:hypothetical protein
VKHGGIGIGRQLLLAQGRNETLPARSSDRAEQAFERRPVELRGRVIDE